MNAQLHEYQVLAKRLETPSTSTLKLRRLNGSIPKFRAGQYITVYFPDIDPVLGKEYTISSSPREEEFNITVKAIGRYSKRLCSLNAGDTFLASGAQGRFYPEDTHSVCMIAGGMGVTPFRSIILETTRSKCRGDIQLLYSGRYSFDMPFSEELYRISCKLPSFKFRRFVTRDAAIPRGAKSHRMRAEDVLDTKESTMSREYLISGSLAFVCDVKGLLSSISVPSERILTEVCF